MTRTRQSPGDQSRAPSKVIAATNSKCTQQTDIWAYGAVFLDDGRVVSIASLRGYRGAVDGVWRVRRAA